MLNTVVRGVTLSALLGAGFALGVTTHSDALVQQGLLIWDAQNVGAPDQYHCALMKDVMFENASDQVYAQVETSASKGSPCSTNWNRSAGDLYVWGQLFYDISGTWLPCNSSTSGSNATTTYKVTKSVGTNPCQGTGQWATYITESHHESYGVGYTYQTYTPTELYYNEP